MSRIVTLYSYRGGTGKSTCAVNLACLLADRGERVAVLDTDLQAPAVHSLLEISGVPEWISFTDYLIGRCTLEEAVQDVEPEVWSADEAQAGGRLFAVPACNRSYKVEEIMERGYDVGLLHEAFDALIESRRLDTLILDTHPGTNNETAVALARCDTVVTMTRAERIDLVNAPKALDRITDLTDARRTLAVGMAPQAGLEPAAVEALENSYQAPVVAVLPSTPALAAGSVSGVFVQAFPRDPLSERYGQLADALSGIRR
jgi:MinD-like ATPase involved in chromosome partitioning or flagellar assembly